MKKKKPKVPEPQDSSAPRAVQLAALREDSELQMRDLIRRRLPGGGSCL